jgi:hypothetical protein
VTETLQTGVDREQLLDRARAALIFSVPSTVMQAHETGYYPYLGADLEFREQPYHQLNLAAGLLARDLGFNETADYHLERARHSYNWMTYEEPSFEDLDEDSKDANLVATAQTLTAGGHFELSSYLATKITNPAAAFDVYDRLYRHGHVESFTNVIAILDHQLELDDIGHPDTGYGLLYRLEFLIKHAALHHTDGLPDLLVIFGAVKERLASYDPTVSEQIARISITHYDRPSFREIVQSTQLN